MREEGSQARLLEECRALKDHFPKIDELVTFIKESEDEQQQHRFDDLF
jgi:hypothetical protein